MPNRMRIAVALVILSALTACQGTKKRTIAVIPKGTAHLFWVTVHEGADRANRAAQIRIPLLLCTPASIDQDVRAGDKSAAIRAEK